MKAISGLLRTEEGEVTDGGVYYEGKPIHKFYPEDVARMDSFKSWKEGV